MSVAAAISSFGQEALKPGGLVEQIIKEAAARIEQHADQSKAKKELMDKIFELEVAIRTTEDWFKEKGLPVPQGGNGIVQHISKWIGSLSAKGHARRQEARLKKIAALSQRLGFLAEQKKMNGGGQYKLAPRKLK